MPFPLWSNFPRNSRPPPWVQALAEVVAAAEDRVSTVERKTGLSSDQVLQALSPNLQALGYSVETGKTKAGKIFRPVLFGGNGVVEGQPRD